MKNILLAILVCCFASVSAQTATEYYNSGGDKLQTKDYKGAIADYDKALKLDPNMAEAYYNRGTAKIYLEQYREAIPDLDNAIRIRPDYEAAYKNRGAAKLHLSDQQGAIADFTAVLKMDPNNASCYFMRGQARLSNNDMNGGCADLNKANELGDKRAQKYITQHCGKYKAGNDDASHETLALDWPDSEGWKVGSNQKTSEQTVIELIRNNETLENWTEIGTMMAVPLPADVIAKITPEIAMNSMLEESKKTCPDAHLTFIEKDEKQKYPWIIFKIECASESQVWQIIVASGQLFMNFRAIKQKNIPDDLAAKWTAFFKTAKVVMR